MASTSFMFWRIRLLHFLSNHCKHLNIVFDFGEDDEVSSSPRSVSVKTKKLGVREGIQGKLALYHVIPFLSTKSF
ncbi:hypothetical protein Patl1_07043 [Pistacia atlantica]|uniref:Uncharacterized protein n=1 Tax=Pistacia atlantica TaxID=434234 RepID=A0ACC1AI89_9ROSI|nr:hypothetical protein Patl1_07043 [Pistacia atlantica]